MQMPQYIGCSRVGSTLTKFFPGFAPGVSCPVYNSVFTSVRARFSFGSFYMRQDQGQSIGTFGFPSPPVRLSFFSSCRGNMYVCNVCIYVPTRARMQGSVVRYAQKGTVDSISVRRGLRDASPADSVPCTYSHSPLDSVTYTIGRVEGEASVPRVLNSCMCVLCAREHSKNTKNQKTHRRHTHRTNKLYIFSVFGISY